MRYIIITLALFLISCTGTGPVVESPQVELPSISEDDTETPITREAKPKYPGNTKRDWPQRWEQWHRYATFVTCSTSGEKVVCSYVLCNYDLVPYEEHSPRYAGRHVTPTRENRYYISRCSMVDLNKLEEKSNDLVEWHP